MSPLPDRPLRADAVRNREKVLRAAREAFAESGYGVPLDEIAARAGVGPGTVYRHFPAKEALFEAVVTARVEDLFAALDVLLRRAQQAGAVRPEARTSDLIALLKGMFAALAGSTDPALRELVFAVLTDGLRPRAK